MKHWLQMLQTVLVQKGKFLYNDFNLRRTTKWFNIVVMAEVLQTET